MPAEGPRTRPVPSFVMVPPSSLPRIASVTTVSSRHDRLVILRGAPLPNLGSRCGFIKINEEFLRHKIHTCIFTPLVHLTLE